MVIVDASAHGGPRGNALPLLLDLALTTLFLHDGSVKSLDELLDPKRGKNSSYPFYIENASQRGDMVEFLRGIDTGQGNSDGSWNNSQVNYNVLIGSDGTDIASAYDANGNIKRMQQWGLKAGGSDKIDDLVYSYNSLSNKLRAVTDNSTGGTPVSGASFSLGDFVNKNNTADDYGYDRNGNMITDLNKRLNGSVGLDQTSGGAITYNYLNLPSIITVQKDDNTNKGSITYTYDAAGNKLQKKVDELNAAVNSLTTNITTTSTYSGGAVYESKSYSNTDASLAALAYTNRLQFLNDEEGRIRFTPSMGTVPARFNYDYFLKDHLGNVRMVLTEEQQTDAYPAASLETATLSNEKIYYSIPDAARTDKSTVPAYPADTYTNPNQWIQKVKRGCNENRNEHCTKSNGR